MAPAIGELQAAALQRAILSSATFSSIATDAKGVIQIFNIGAQRMLGYTAEEVINRMSPADLHDPQEVIARAALLSAEFGELIQPGFEALVFKASRGIEDIYELTKIRKDGSRFPAVISVTALRDPQDAIIGYLLIGTDNTARHEADRERQKLDAETKRFEQALQQVEGRRERDAAHAQELAELNAELEAFSYSVSHDLRAPLRHIHGYIEMLHSVTAGALSETAERYLATITAASVEMAELIDDLLAFSRVGRAEIRAGVVDMDELVRDAILGLEMATRNRPIEWEVHPLPRVIGDSGLLKQVLTNLIDNAVKYSGPRKPARIEIGCAGEENGLPIFFIKDNGVGFDMQYADKLFGVFQRLHRPDEFTGTGIGLATVRRIVGRHGGRVWGEGLVDTGATFFFTLDAAPASSMLPVERMAL